MFAARAKRVRPHLDDKVLASWNGMMLGAIARAGAVLGDDSYRAAAERNLAFLQGKLWDAKSKALYSRWRDGERDNVQLLDAHANLAAGVIQLYETTLDPKQLEFALALAEKMVALFYDSKDGGFFQSPAGAGDLILRIKDDYDGAEPSGNSVATHVLQKLGKICDRKDFLDASDKTLRLFAERLQMQPQAVPYLLSCLDFAMEEPKRAVIVGPKPEELLHAVHQVYQPNKVVLGVEGPVEEFAKGLRVETKARAFVCTGTACKPPTDQPSVVKEHLK
jgi:hypothetical protein